MSKVAILFPGQGSQTVGMGKALFERYASVRDTFAEAGETLGYDLQALCFEGTIEQLSQTEVTQPALLAVGVAAFRALREETDIEPAFLAGHSLGEISALTAAGAIRFADALRIVQQRGRFMQEAANEGTGAMLAVSGLPLSDIEETLGQVNEAGGTVVVSNLNSSAQIVISGIATSVEQAGDLLKARGAVTVALKVSAPFHSPLMAPAAVKLREELAKYTLSAPQWPVLSNVTGRPYPDAASITELLVEQMTAAVRWTDNMHYLHDQGVVQTIEVAPKTVLTKLVKRDYKSIQTFSYETDEQVDAVQAEFGPDAASAEPKTNVVTKCIAIAVCTRNRNWDDEAYRKGVIEPYRRVQQIQEQLDQTGEPPTLEQMKEALDMLRSVFETKQTPVQERQERFEELLRDTGTRELFQEYEMIPKQAQV